MYRTKQRGEHWETYIEKGGLVYECKQKMISCENLSSKSHEREWRIYRVIVKSGVSALELGGDLVNCFHLDSIFEFYARDHLRQVVETA